MTERICKLLDLDLSAGLGRRLAETEIRQDPQNSNHFYIFPKDDVVEAATLAHALSVRATEVLRMKVHFTAIRTVTYH